MNDSYPRELVLKLYRIQRRIHKPYTAMHEVRMMFADQIARTVLFKDRDPSPDDRQAWLYAEQLGDIIQARWDRPGYAGRYWLTGQQFHYAGAYLVTIDGDYGPTIVTGCKSLACAIKHGMVALAMRSGGSFTVTDRAGHVYIERATELSTMGELFDQAKTVRA